MYSLNVPLVPFTDVLFWILGFWVAIALVLMPVMKFWPAKADQVACVLSGSAIFLFSYAFFAAHVGQAPLIGPLAQTTENVMRWWLVTGLLVVAGMWVVGRFPGGIRFMNTAGAILLVLSAGTIVKGLMPKSRSAGPADASVSRDIKPPKTTPDIFYIILDGYGREDQLQRVFGIDNKPFLDSLRNMGFFVADESHSNYVQTQLSLASSLNLDYLPEVVDTSDPDPGRATLNEAIDKSRVWSFLKARGYVYFAIGSGFPALSFKSADYVFLEHMRVPHLSRLLLDLTPLSRTGYVISRGIEEKRSQIKSAFSNTLELVRPTGKPRFVFAHILAPHPSFVFNEDGSPRSDGASVGLWDGSHYYEAGGTLKEYVAGYRAQLGYINRRVLELVDRIVQSNPNAVIILQGDHGSKSQTDQDSLEKTDTAEVSAILNAYRVPAAVKPELYPSISPVNSFRALFRGLFDADLPPLQDKSYYSTWDNPYQFTEVPSSGQKKK